MTTLTDEPRESAIARRRRELNIDDGTADRVRCWVSSMHETPHGFFHLDRPADGAPPAAGPVRLAGWAAGTAGRHFVDLRVRHGDAVHPVVYGFPRADLAAFFQLDAPFLPGGFEVTLALPAGTAAIRFEALDITGHWHALHTETLTCADSAIGAAVADLAAEILPHDFARALLGTLRAADRDSVADAARAAAAALPQPAVLRFPHQPFHGHLHQPTLSERVLFGRLRIEGWLFHETQAIRRVTATVDLQTAQDLQLGGRKDYVAAMYPDFPQAADCRIDGLIDIPVQLPNPLCVRIYAELADGSWHLCQVQRLHSWDQETEKQPLAPFRLSTYLRAVRALDQACRTRGFRVPWTRPFWRGLRSALTEYRLRARPRRTAASAADPAPPAATAAPAAATLFTHNLAREGAPLFLLELVRHYAGAGMKLRVVAAADGPLAAAYRELGADVQVVDDGPLRRATDVSTLNAALAVLARAVDPGEPGLIVANTLSMWWAVHLARRWRRPSLLYIHESTTPATFYLGHMAPATLPPIERTFRIATQVSFLTQSTRAYYRPWLGPRNHSLNPGWIDVSAIDATLDRQSRATARQRLGLPDGTRLVVNVGAVCDRKGQHIFARGVDLLWRQSPELAAGCRFLMVGGRDTLFDRDMDALLHQLGRSNLRIIPATNEPLPYYQAADLFACTSYEESLPRVVMEAMVCRVPILSTAVHGIRDLLPDASHAHLIPPGDSQAVCDGLRRMLTAPADCAAMTEKSRARVSTVFNTSVLLPRHLALAGAVARLAL